MIKVVGIKKIVDDISQSSSGDDGYLDIFLTPILKCKEYKPKLGVNDPAGIDIDGFLSLYGNDPFYSWIGLDNDLMYAAHKAAGGMTSIYRQIGVGCERLFRQILIDNCHYDDEIYANWSYETKTSGGKIKTLYLDGRLEISQIKNAAMVSRLNTWMDEYCSNINVQKPKNGVVFEVRQGYKSKDSKRQNGDIDNATVAWANGYLPVFAIFSSQIDKDVVYRYINNRCGILTGIDEPNEHLSIFAFFREIIGYDLAGFFMRNSDKIKKDIHSVLSALLSSK